MRSILVVDDTPLVRDMLVTMLAQADYLVRTAGSAHEALKMVEAYRPALVLMDLVMPEMDGLEATAHIKAQPHLAHIPVVAVTGWSAPESQARASAAGCADVLPKPFDRQSLLSMVRSYV